MPNLGPMEILLILAVVLLLFGPKKLPELAKGIGQSVREFRKGTQGLKDELESSLKDEPIRSQPVSHSISAPVSTPSSSVETIRAEPAVRIEKVSDS